MNLEIYQERTEELLQEAFNNPDKAANLIANPLEYFSKGGLDLSTTNEEDFNVFFKSLGSDFTQSLAGVADGSNQMLEGSIFGKVKCYSCMTGAFVVATIIIGVGAVGIADLTVESAAVIALAEFAHVSVEAALAFIGSITAIISDGPTKVAKAICKWIHACK
ncbi:MAG: hypothetical protein N4A49_11960 [Marinifilaceae bacterium]|jgi:hypothetical protein|nr:hypothetical protein [Marinifilaceae bacterium]